MIYITYELWHKMMHFMVRCCPWRRRISRRKCTINIIKALKLKRIKYAYKRWCKQKNENSLMYNGTSRNIKTLRKTFVRAEMIFLYVLKSIYEMTFIVMWCSNKALELTFSSLLSLSLFLRRERKINKHEESVRNAVMWIISEKWIHTQKKIKKYNFPLFLHTEIPLSYALNNKTAFSIPICLHFSYIETKIICTIQWE